MAKKAKRRGRPPGSKNRGSLGNSVAEMDIGQLRKHIDDLQNLLAKKVSEQRAHLQSQLAQLGGYRSKKASTIVTAAKPGGKGNRAKPKPKYQSKKNKSLKWTGRGVTPVWMREEMKDTKLTKDDFLIK
jgi:DNA-binding protein H-NS